MHITRDLLLNAAKDFVSKSVKVDRSIIAVYLTGSLLTEYPLLGGSTDIDLVFVHDRAPTISREIQRFTDEITLDLYHHYQDIYEQPRLLRVEPILGPAINSTRIIFHDTQHWFEYTQAIITAQFSRIDHHAERIRKLATNARTEWFALESKENATPKEMVAFLKSVEHATNSVACLSGLPLAERRFMIDLAERCQAVENPQFAISLASLLGFSSFDFQSLEEWINRWSTALSASDNPATLPPEIHPFRNRYYINAVNSYFENGQLESCLWIMLKTWTLLSSVLSAHAIGAKEYPVFLSSFGFNKTSFLEKISSLDSYLDAGEDIITSWAQEAGE